jgi:hypothetical protein
MRPREDEPSGRVMSVRTDGLKRGCGKENKQTVSVLCSV